MVNPAGVSESGAIRLDFDRRVMVQFRAPWSRPTPDCWPTANLTMYSD
jgi:hypothetical protein